MISGEIPSVPVNCHSPMEVQVNAVQISLISVSGIKDDNITPGHKWKQVTFYTQTDSSALAVHCACSLFIARIYGYVIGCLDKDSCAIFSQFFFLFLPLLLGQRFRTPLVFNLRVDFLPLSCSFKQEHFHLFLSSCLLNSYS